MTAIMGILNVTPDSFSDGGEFFSLDKAIERAFQMEEEGADIIDIGGESTRPGSSGVSSQEEIDRVCPVIEKVASETSLPVSVDTNKASVAREALKAGATIVNDVSGLSFDDSMGAVVAEYGARLIIMHMRGTPATMQQYTHYEDLIQDISSELMESVARARNSGIDDSRIILDPGIGFAKSLEDNYRIINNIEKFKKMGYPVCVGLSRKSLIWKLSQDQSENRLPSTIALNTVSIMKGADIIRVHDVKAHSLALESLEMLRSVSVS